MDVPASCVFGSDSFDAKACIGAIGEYLAKAIGVIIPAEAQERGPIKELLRQDYLGDEVGSHAFLLRLADALREDGQLDAAAGVTNLVLSRELASVKRAAEAHERSLQALGNAQQVRAVTNLKKYVDRARSAAKR
jgi:hypothetical protein